MKHKYRSYRTAIPWDFRPQEWDVDPGPHVEHRLSAFAILQLPSRKGIQVRVNIKRAYEAPSRDDGTRVLIDRLWPRGVSKDDAHIDHWLKNLAPSTELRKWFGHDTARWEEFTKRYADELDEHAEALGQLLELAQEGPVTLVYATHDERHNNAVVLRDILQNRHSA